MRAHGDVGGSAKTPSSALFAGAFAIAALVPALLFRGFMVDDALITARYAANLAAGHGYRLNANGPVTDGVTPLGFAYVLAPFAKGGALAAFAAAKWIGIGAWTIGAAVIGLAVRRVIVESSPVRTGGAPPFANGVSDLGGAGARQRDRGWAPRFVLLSAVIPLAILVTSAPLAAWAASGMETGLVLGLGALAIGLAILERPVAAMACAGIAAGWRPELVPWAGTLGIGWWLAHRKEPGGARAWVAAVLSVAPFVVVACVRVAVFGRPAPLSIFAKAPDARLGLYYAAACALLAGPPAIVAPLAFSRLSRFEKAVVGSVVAHVIAIGLAGGDWMPLSRLMVPVLPTIAIAALLLAKQAAPWATVVRMLIALGGQLFVLVKVGPTAARVAEDRVRVLEELRPALATSRVVASLDIGWVGAVTEGALVDLAGVTDPRIAALPGGHTTKQIPAGLLDARGVDTLVLLLAPGEEVATPWTRSRWARGVEGWIATTPNIEESFRVVATSSPPLVRYVVLRRVP
ncbi:MAG: hypothetical protein U0441_29925 [Polyangiaceae bacterium]